MRSGQQPEIEADVRETSYSIAAVAPLHNEAAMASGNLQAIVYIRGSLKVLDQLKIPQESVYIDVPDSQRAWDVIRSMQVRGAPMIAMVAATGLACEVLTKHAAGAFADAAVACAHLLERMGHLKTARPTAVNVFRAVDVLSALVMAASTAEGATAQSVVDAYVERAEVMLADDLADNKAIGEAGADDILRVGAGQKINMVALLLQPSPCPSSARPAVASYPPPIYAGARLSGQSGCHS